MTKFLKIPTLLFYYRKIIIILMRLHTKYHASLSFVKRAENQNSEHSNLGSCVWVLGSEHRKWQKKRKYTPNITISKRARYDIAIINKNSPTQCSTKESVIKQYRKVAPLVETTEVLDEKSERGKPENEIDLYGDPQTSTNPSAIFKAYRFSTKKKYNISEKLENIINQFAQMNTIDKCKFVNDTFKAEIDDFEKITADINTNLKNLEKKILDINKEFMKTGKDTVSELFMRYKNILVGLDNYAYNYLDYLHQAERRILIIKHDTSIIQDKYILLTTQFYAAYAQLTEHLLKYNPIKEKVACFEVVSSFYENIYKFFIWNSTIIEPNKLCDDMHLLKLSSYFKDHDRSRHVNFSISVLINKSHANFANWKEEEICKIANSDDKNKHNFIIKSMYIKKKEERIGYIFFYKSTVEWTKNHITNCENSK